MPVIGKLWTDINRTDQFYPETSANAVFVSGSTTIGSVLENKLEAVDYEFKEIKVLTMEQYEATSPKDPTILYLIKEEQ